MKYIHSYKNEMKIAQSFANHQPLIEYFIGYRWVNEDDEEVEYPDRYEGEIVWNINVYINRFGQQGFVVELSRPMQRRFTPMSIEDADEALKHFTDDVVHFRLPGGKYHTVDITRERLKEALVNG